MGDDVRFDPDQFWKRISCMYKSWNDDKQDWGGVDSWVLVNGKRDETDIYTRTLATQLWLTSFELFDTVSLFTKDTVYFLASSKKVKLLTPLIAEAPNGLRLEVLTRSKSDDSSNFRTLIASIKSSGSGKKLGLIQKDKFNGKFATGFRSCLDSIEGIDIIDVTAGVASLLAVKDEEEVKYMRQAASVSTLVLSKYLIAGIEEDIAEDSPKTHSAYSEKCDSFISDPGSLASIIPSALQVSTEEVDTCYTPNIMSGGKYTFRTGAQADENVLQCDTIILTLGVRYRSYCSNITRTLLINASKEKKRAYTLLCAVFDECVATLKPGNRMSDVYKAAISTIRSRNPELELNFTKNCGFGIGLDFKDPSLLLNSTNSRLIRSGMVFNLCVGFDKMNTSGASRGKPYALLIADTVLVGTREAEVLTTADRVYRDVSYKMDLGDEEPATVLPDFGGYNDDVAGPRTRRSRKSPDDVDLSTAEMAARREQQAELARKKQEEALKKYVLNQVDKDIDMDRDSQKVMDCYASPSQFPPDAKPTQLHVDVQHEALLVPVNGQLVPFHVNTIKSINDTVSGAYTFLRINFVTPDAVLAKHPLAEYADRNSVFLKELSFRSKDPRNLKKVLRMIKELQKRVAQRASEKAEKASMVSQADIKLNKDRKNIPRLRDLQVRPKIGRGKAVTGMLEAHLTGLRYVPGHGDRIDILYSNIKHAIFQPCDGTVSVVIHFQLKSAIMVGKKRVDYIQVSRDVLEASTDLGRAGMHDRDSLREEQEERHRRRKFNQRFLEFTQAVEENVATHDASNVLEFDRPYRDLSFPGVPDKGEVLILPTLYCLVALDDNPPWVLTLSEVEVAYFERVQLSLKNFDLVLVYKDLDRQVEKLRSIPIKYLSTIQNYLTESNIVYFVGPMNLQWPRILKEIRADVKGFIELGGWEQILGENEDEEGSEDMVSDYEDVEDAFGSESEDSEEYIDSDEDLDEIISDEDAEFDSEDDDAPDWDELEQEAMRQDRKRALDGRGFDDDEGRSAPKRRR